MYYLRSGGLFGVQYLKKNPNKGGEGTRENGEKEKRKDGETIHTKRKKERSNSRKTMKDKALIICSVTS